MEWREAAKGNVKKGKVKLGCLSRLVKRRKAT